MKCIWRVTDPPDKADPIDQWWKRPKKKKKDKKVKQPKKKVRLENGASSSGQSTV